MNEEDYRNWLKSITVYSNLAAQPLLDSETERIARLTKEKRLKSALFLYLDTLNRIAENATRLGVYAARLYYDADFECENFEESSQLHRRMARAVLDLDAVIEFLEDFELVQRLIISQLAETTDADALESLEKEVYQ